MKKYIVTGIVIGALALYGFPYFTRAQSMEKITVTLSSNSFENGGTIPAKYTCAGENISPHLLWSAKPSDTVKSYLLVVDDPDAQKVVGKTFVHWIVLMPASITSLEKGASSKQGTSHSLHATEFENDFKMSNYGGPCPPKGTGIHTYRFTLFALDETPEAIQSNPAFPKAPFTAEAFRESVGGNIIGEARIVAGFIQE